MDFVFLVVAVFAGGVSLKRFVFAGGDDDDNAAKALTTTFEGAAQVAYQAIIAAFFLKALDLDRRPQAETSPRADFDRRIGVLSRRMLDFGFAKDQAAPRFRLCALALVLAALAVAILDEGRSFRSGGRFFYIPPFFSLGSLVGSGPGGVPPPP